MAGVHCTARLRALTVPRYAIPCPPANPPAGDYTAAALAWLESGGEADLDALVKELTNPKLAELTAARQAPPPSPAPAGDE